MRFDNSKCPVCGSIELTEHVEKGVKIAEFDGIVCKIDEIVVKCSDCKSTGDFFDKNDNVILAALDKFDIRCVSHIIERFEKFKISFTSVERILGFKFGFFKDWKAGNIGKLPKDTITLLKLIFMYPWLLITVEEKYNTKKAREILKFAAERKEQNEQRRIN